MRQVAKESSFRQKRKALKSRKEKLQILEPIFKVFLATLCFFGEVTIFGEMKKTSSNRFEQICIHFQAQCSLILSTVP